MWNYAYSFLGNNFGLEVSCFEYHVDKDTETDDETVRIDMIDC